MIAYALIGAMLRRIFGGAFEIKRIYSLIGMAALAVYLATLGTNIVLGLVIGVVTVIYWTMGHGSYMDMGTSPKLDNERFKYVMIWLLGTETKPSMWRDFLGMTIRYATPAFLIGALYCLVGKYEGLLFTLVGLLTAIAYLVFMRVNKHLPKNKFVDSFTAYGELAAGAIFYSGLYLLI